MTLTRLAPEGFDIANAYLEFGSAEEVANQLHLPVHSVVETLKRKDVKDYLDAIYLDLGYRNRNKLGSLLDEIVESKLEEARESGVYSSKDLLEILQFIHKMRMDEAKLQEKPTIGTNVQIANFGEGNYGKLMDKLLGGTKVPRDE